MTYFYAGTPNWVFSMFAFVGFLCSTIPLPWHLEAWNNMIWTALACLTLHQLDRLERKHDRLTIVVPRIYWRADPYSAASVETLRWATVACALLFFAYFGFADEAIKNYRGRSSPSLSRGATLPVFIRKDTTQKRDSFDSFSDMSASYGGISPLEYEDKEKALTLGDGDARVLSLGDVSDMLPDCNESDYSSSAPSSDTESVHSAREEIEVSSLHRASVHITLSPPEPAHVRRSSVPDGPMPVVDAADIV
ncbi:hypothetical protein B0H13DRAFT_2309424 [Mycena leptocephala]|nr:hypothetical protein B0H13DRAFT_2309424 [Mycena leptocephala]